MSSTIPNFSPTAPASILQVNEMLGVEVPLPALPWDVDRIVEKISNGCWFSHYCRSKGDADADGHTLLM
jgi:hypothetical protein